MKNNQDENKVATPNRFKVLKISIFIVIGILIAIVVARYLTEEEFRSFVDTNILKKSLEEGSLNSIETDYESASSILAYDNYVGVLSKNTLTLYTSNASEAGSLEVTISSPVYSTNGRYLVIAEENSKKIYLIKGTTICWQTELEGEISRVDVNKNGYVSVIITNTTYKSVIVSFSPSGKELFRSYLSSTYAVCTSISTDNKYLAIGEVDYSGTIVNSHVRITSMELAQTDPNNSVVYTYESENNEVITNIKYQSSDTAVCMFSSYVQKVTPEGDERLIDVDDNSLFLDVNLKNGVVLLEKQSSGLYSYEYQMKILSTSKNSERLYILDSDVPKSVIVANRVIAINLGTEVRFVGSNGFLLKTYTSSQEIKDIVIGENIAGIVYKDKIELINI